MANDHRATGRRSRAPVTPWDDSLLLAEAKLAVPRMRSGLVERPRLQQRFDARTASLTLVAAPVGYGKTTAALAWCASRSAPQIWVTLDVQDNDPARLWQYVATGADRTREGLGRGALQRLRSAGGFTEGMVVELMNALGGFDAEVVIVLDDLHLVTDLDCLASIEHALECLPPNVRMILLSRTDPALHLSRHRAGENLAELRAEDLSFTEAEAQELLVGRAGLDLDAADVALLHQRTEGWPAAISLAALWLAGVEDPSPRVREFGGDVRFVADYLTEEVVAALDEDTRTFVLAAAVLGQFDAELCDRVLGRSDSAARLAELERSNLFLTRLEPGHWYRMHRLFADFASYQLAARSPGAAEEIHRAAATALRAAGRPVEAVDHAAAAGDHAMVADVLLEHHLAMIRAGRSRTLLGWISGLPDEVLIERPALAAAGATAAMSSGNQTVTRRRLLTLADRGIEASDDAESYARAVSAMVRAAAIDGSIGEAVTAGRQAVQLASTDPAAEGVLVSAYGALARALYFAGDDDGAWTAALTAIVHPDAEQRAPGHALARSTLALIAAARGRVASARVHGETARSILGSVGMIRTWLGGNASAALGCVLLAEGHLPAAERELAHAEHVLARRGRDGALRLDPGAAGPRACSPGPARRGHSGTRGRAGGDTRVRRHGCRRFARR